jgi:hypothetical protein
LDDGPDVAADGRTVAGTGGCHADERGKDQSPAAGGAEGRL